MPQKAVAVISVIKGTGAGGAVRDIWAEKLSRLRERGREDSRPTFWFLA